MSLNRPEIYRFHNGGQKHALPFADQEYHDRLEGLRDIIQMHGLDAVVLTSVYNVAYYSGCLYSSFGRPCACVVTQTDCVTISAGIDAGQPWRRSIGDNISHADGTRDSMWRAVASITGTGKAVGCEADHLTMQQAEMFGAILKPKRGMDIAPATMHQRLTKSPAEIALVREAANVADIGGLAIREAIRVGASELEISIAGRTAMEREIARRFGDAEYRDTWVRFQSGINTDGAHNPVTNRKLQHGDILTMTCHPMISGYSAPLARTLFLGDVDEASRVVWQSNIDSHTFAAGLLTPGASCAGIARKLDEFLAGQQMQSTRTSGHGIALLSHHFGGEVAPDPREEPDTILEPGMLITTQPMLTIPDGMPGAGGYREQDIYLVTDGPPERITEYPSGPAFNVVA